MSSYEINKEDLFSRAAGSLLKWRNKEKKESLIKKKRKVKSRHNQFDKIQYKIAFKKNILNKIKRIKKNTFTINNLIFLESFQVINFIRKGILQQNINSKNKFKKTSLFCEFYLNISFLFFILKIF